MMEDLNKEQLPFEVSEKDLVVIDEKASPGLYLALLDDLYYQWKHNPSGFIIEGRNKYKEVFDLLLKALNISEIKKKKFIKVIQNLKENHVVRICYKTYSLKINLEALEKNISGDFKKLFWLKLKEDYLFLQHLLFYVLIISDSC